MVWRSRECELLHDLESSTYTFLMTYEPRQALRFYGQYLQDDVSRRSKADRSPFRGRHAPLLCGVGLHRRTLIRQKKYVRLFPILRVIGLAGQW